MAFQEADRMLEIAGGATRRWPGGLAPVPDPLLGDRCSHPDALPLLTVIAERIADLDLDGMLVEISGMLDGAAALVSAEGIVLAGDRAAVPAAERLRAASRALPAGRGPQPPSGETILPVRESSGAAVAYLCVEGAAALLDGETWPMLNALLAAAAALQLERRDAAQRAEGDFLLSLLFAGDGFPEADLARWAHRLGVDLARPVRVTFFSQSQWGVGRRPLEQDQRLRDILTMTVERPLLAGVRDGIVCLCADPGPNPSRHWVRVWERILPHMTEAGIGGVTVGGPFAGVSGVRRSYRQARALAERQRNAGRVLAAPGVSVYEEGGVTEILLGHPDSENLQAYVRRVLGPLLDDARFGGELAETLQAYLATGGSPAGAAELLHLHPSSVKYRIRVIRDLLGGDQLDDHDHRFELELALRMLRTFKDLDDASQPRRTNAEGLSSRRGDVDVATRP